MKSIRIMLIEFKKTLSTNFVLCFILLLSIVISYSVFVFYNDAFFSEQRKFLSSHLMRYSVSIHFNESLSYCDTEKILTLFDDSFCDYVLLSCNTQTPEETYTISSVSTLIPIAKDPYHFLYSTLTQSRLDCPPAAGHAYITNKFTTGRTGEGLFIYGSFSVEDHNYVISDICAMSYKPLEVLISISDFQKHNQVDSLTYVFKEHISLSSIHSYNEKISLLVPNADISINNQLSELSQAAYNDSVVIISILLLACILNYCLIFTYLAQKRCDDYMIMRLYGITRLKITGLLLLEIVLYNISAFIISMCGFSVYWLAADDVSILLHYRDSLPVIALFLFGSFIIGLYNVVKLGNSMPIDYKKIRN